MGILHSCILKLIPDVEIAALCEKSSITCRFLKKIYAGIRIVDNVEKLADSNIDAVYITTPIPSHFAIARIVYSKNVARNLFVEKTLANSYEEAKELCSLADSFRGVNMVGYLRRFYVTFRKAKELLSQGTIGEVSSFEAYAYSSDFFGVKQRTSAFVARGGVLKDLGCHAVDLALWFFGDLRIASTEVRSLSGSYFEDCVDFGVIGSDGLEGKFTVSAHMKDYHMPEVGLSIIGSKGNMTVNDDKIELTLNEGKSFVWYRHDLNDNVPFWLGLPAYYREDLHFIKAMKKECAAEPDFHEASKVDEIISQVEKNVGRNDK